MPTFVILRYILLCVSGTRSMLRNRADIFATVQLNIIQDSIEFGSVLFKITWVWLSAVRNSARIGSARLDNISYLCSSIVPAPYVFLEELYFLYCSVPFGLPTAVESPVLWTSDNSQIWSNIGLFITIYFLFLFHILEYFSSSKRGYF